LLCELWMLPRQLAHVLLSSRLLGEHQMPPSVYQWHCRWTKTPHWGSSCADAPVAIKGNAVGAARDMAPRLRGLKILADMEATRRALGLCNVRLSPRRAVLRDQVGMRGVMPTPAAGVWSGRWQRSDRRSHAGDRGAICPLVACRVTRSAQRWASTSQSAVRVSVQEARVAVAPQACGRKRDGRVRPPLDQ
jgi:hypothetical protein